MDLVKVNPFLNVGAGAKATTQFEPEGPASLFGLIFQMYTGGGGGAGANFVDDLDALTIKHSGKVLVPSVTGARLTDMIEYEGATADNDYFFLGFGDPFARTARGQHLGNFDFTHFPGRMTIEADIGSSATTPSLECWAVLAPPKSLMGHGYTLAEQQAHRALIETILQPAAAVNDKAFDIGLGSEHGALLRRLFNFHSNITRLSVKRQGFDIYEDIPNDLAAWFQQDVFTRVPQSGMLVWDPIVDGNQSESKSTVNPQTGAPYNYQYRVTTSGSDTITVLADVLTNLRRL